MKLIINNLHVAYGNIKALQGVSFEIEEGSITTIIGANGAGKTTTLRAISRLVPVGPDSSMTLGEINMLDYPPERVVSELGISHVPEGRRLFGNMTVLENMQLAAYARKNKSRIQRDIDRMFAVFERLEERKDQKAGTMSGGEQQMLAVARAFVSGRRFMLLDEPSMGLSPLLMQRVFAALGEINKEGTTILLVEQNARMALNFAQYAYLLEAGRVIKEGSTEEMANDPEVKKSYLGG
ncbi:MAG: ABC transporter ATP-binding protein [Proteobacteria bacterium]|nr:ABC transporter ATP-binding protein [Pseudomonadota bacterium]MBU1610992.1 ABC transporter ATP-binding protein [Pseudomonadota bacterium]